ncbi:VOC family protein [Hyphobacterium sp. CCMP332]|nr:VOC family protein [Hyphobacterium sp. CCMP332]
MKRVTGLGGIFFKSEDPDKSKEWYKKHLGLNTNQYGATFHWRHADEPDKKGRTEWGPFDKNTEYMNPSKKDFMINYRVDNLEKLLEALKKEGVQIVGEMETYEYGKFGWIMDPDGVKIELWEPLDESVL